MGCQVSSLVPMGQAMKCNIYTRAAFRLAIEEAVVQAASGRAAALNAQEPLVLWLVIGASPGVGMRIAP